MVYQNATAINGISTMASIAPGGLVGVIILILIVSIMIMLLSNEMIARKILKFISFLKKSFELFFYGVCSALVLGLGLSLTMINVEQVKSGNPIMLKIIIAPILFYAIMTAFGWVVKKVVVDRIRLSFKKAVRKEIVAKRVS